ncbi:hypothetical protein [Limisalsivibrio acetivorans]|uniref:hypothetical protein n=1 Tax=Limisalsivibrio acetivorans TaxID=1304888 RepID=UPI0003B34E68|nr:hypothetical protein [Limisalsivibrio acetivorans]
MAINWEKMRADFEISGESTGGLARKYCCTERTIQKRIADEGWQRSNERVKVNRIKILNAIHDSTLKGLEKADWLLDECENLKDLEIHSKTVKNYRDIGVTKTEEIVKEDSISTSLEDLYDGLGLIGDDEVERILDNEE